MLSQPQNKGFINNNDDTAIISIIAVYIIRYIILLHLTVSFGDVTAFNDWLRVSYNVKKREFEKE